MHTLDLSIHPVNSTLKMLASLLERITTANDKIKQSLPEPESPMVMTPAQHQIHTSFTRFHARSIPSISINAYLTRILKYCPCANECFLSLLVYFDRMARNVEEITGGEGRQFSIDSYNIHRLIIAGIMVSAKYFSDVFFTNSRYAKVGGLPVSELNQLEVEFLTLNNFALAISIEELQTYGDQLMKHWMCEEVANRDPEDETPSPAVPSAPTPTPPSNEREYSNGDAEQGGSSRYAEHHDPRYESSSRPSPSQKQPSQHQHQDTVRREVRQDDHHHHRQAQHRQDYRNNSHASEPRHDQRKEHRQDQGRDYRQDPHHQVSSHSQQQHSHQYRHRQGQEPTLDRSYMSDRPGRYQTPPNGPITPTEMTHATSRLAAPSPIH
ncbi:PHO85 cyclin-6/7 [Entomortierella parvispora]|uniref:PHO85 cyclin-6/7 n=1 Tax=Entomortierella parvispora TaxID=205924 RepID=A0A9P3H4S1_9FUNG|nr:PHO85 cyclin-6/7 [Entomortierella parvispora]